MPHHRYPNSSTPQTSGVTLQLEPTVLPRPTSQFNNKLNSGVRRRLVSITSRRRSSWLSPNKRPTSRKKTANENEQDAEAHLYKAYHDHAVAEDVQLVKKYSEDIASLLTFAGLLSAIITAFLLVEQTDFKLQSTATTNVLLHNIFLQVQGSRPGSSGYLGPLSDTFYVTQEDQGSKVISENLETSVVALYYSSLTSSLLSAFGGLVTKQWIMHYESLPPWADNVVRQSQLRRMRHQALRSWGFYIVMGVIPLLIQISLILFSVGVLLAASPGGIVYTIMLVSILIGSAFWAITVLLGTFAPSSPFKSPTSQAFIRVLAWVNNFPFYYHRLADFLSLSLGRHRHHHTLIPRGQLLEDRDSFKKSWGEASCLEDELFSAGILWWGLRLPWQGEPPLTDADQRLAGLRLMGEHSTEANDNKHALVVREVVGQDPLLLDWISATLDRLAMPSPPGPEDLKVQVHTLCYFVYHIPTAAGFLRDSRLCGAVRLCQGVSNDEPLEISQLPEATVVTYFRGFLWAGLSSDLKVVPTLVDVVTTIFQGFLLAGASDGVATASTTSIDKTALTIPVRLGVPDATKNHDVWIRGALRYTLCEEISSYLQQFQDKFNSNNQSAVPSSHHAVEDVAVAIALAAVAVTRVDKAKFRGLSNAEAPFARTKLAQCEPYEQICRALHRMSSVDPLELGDSRLCKVMTLSVSVSSILLCDPRSRRKLVQCESLEDGSFLQSLTRLSDLAQAGSDDTGEDMLAFRTAVATLVHSLHAYPDSLPHDLRDLLDQLAKSAHLDFGEKLALHAHPRIDSPETPGRIRRHFHLVGVPSGSTVKDEGLGV